MYRVSIIVPVYNQEKFLDECLDSIVDQDMDEYQVLLIDDGSTDRSKEICERYIKRYSFFQYIYQENSGLGSARNTGIRYAEGTYILFVDSDDVLAKNCLKTLIDYMAGNNLDILYVDEMICDEQLRMINVCPTYPYMQTLIKKEQALEFCMQPSHICSRIFNRKLFENIRFEDIWYEDMESFPELISLSKNIGYFKAPVYYYRQHEEAITHNDLEPRNLDVIKAWDKGIHLPSLSERERNSVTKAVIKSVATFLFFKMGYAREYIAWYQDTLEGRITVQKDSSVPEGNLMLQNDYPLIQQAKIVGNHVLADRLEVLKELYLEGGFCYFTKYDERKKSLEIEHLSFIQKTELELYSIKINPKSPVLYYAIEELQKQNLISQRGELKNFILEKVLVQTFLEFGYPVRIL